MRTDPMRTEAVIIGGSFAGLSAALYIARARRRVVVVDAGRPRNRFAVASHGFFGQDGRDPQTMIATAAQQLQAYPSARLIRGTVSTARATNDGFAVQLDSGDRLQAERLVLAFGLSDALPDLPGLAQRWGRSVLHCPYCHGFELGGRPLGVLQSHPMSAHQAQLVADWGPTTLFLNGAPAPDADTHAALSRRGVTVEPAPIDALIGAEPELEAIQLADGRRVPVAGLFVAPRSRLSSPLATQLGCVVDQGPAGPIIRTDANRETTVPGVHAAGDIARAPHSVSWAVADGVTAGVAVHRSLVFPALAAA